MKLWNQDLYIKAWNFASEAHLGQFLPDSKVSYLNHIGNVAMEVTFVLAKSNSIKDPDLAVQCALLHDVIEDTEVKYESLLNLFSKEVADGVMALTKNKDFPTKEEKMNDSLSRIKLQPHEIWVIKMADRIVNLQKPPQHWSNEKIIAYRREAKGILDALQEANELLAERLSQKIHLYKKYCKI